MNWRLVVALLVAFGFGWVLCSWRSLIRHDHWQRRAIVAEANTNHSLCVETENTMARYIALQEDLLDTYRSGKDLGDEATDWLKAEGS